MTRSVLVVAAHPDDEVLGMGGAIARHVDFGDRVTVLWVTDGSSAQYPGEPETLTRKLREGEAALALLGVTDCVKGNLPDMRLDTVSHLAVNCVVDAALERAGAEIVYAPFPDINLDHRAVFDSVAVATRSLPGARVRRFVAYAVPSGAEWTATPTLRFTPNWFIDITNSLDRKIAAFSEIRTEVRDWPHPRSVQAIRARAEVAGSTAGVAAAEPFMLIRSLEG